MVVPASAELLHAARRYRVGTQLAGGSMGDVFVAFDTLTQREVAYRRLAPHSERARAQASAAFEREYELLARLSHPNIVEVYDYGFDAAGPYYTLELLSGKSLAELAPLPLAAACRLIRDLASALGLVHAQGLLHRDLSPVNVRITDDGRAKLLGFAALTRFGRPAELLGTPPFIAPESLSQEPLDQRADLYALGALAYWTLTRRLPYQAHSIGELRQAWETPLEPPSAFVPELPAELDQLLLALLAREPAARPRSSAELIERLNAIASLPPEQDQARSARSYLQHPALAGRAQLLRDFAGYLQEARHGRGRAVLLRGAAGLGASALLEQLATDARQLGITVLHWQNDSAHGSWGLGQSLLGRLRAGFPEAAKAVLERDPALGSLFDLQSPRLRREGVRSGVEASEQQARRVSVLQEFLLAASRRAPLLLVADDLQRADAQTLALIASLARAVPKYPLLLVASARADACCAEPNALAQLAASASCVTLRELSESDLAQLVQSLFGEVPNCHRLADWLFARSGGNPAACLDLSRRLLELDELRYANGAFSLPYAVHGDECAPTAAELALTRVAQLGADALALARLLSVHEGAAGCARLCAASPLGAERTLLALSELRARGIVRRVGDSIAFTSESLRDALERALPERERKALHLCLARAIASAREREPEARFAVCGHLLAAGEERQAVELAIATLRQHAFAYDATPARVPLLERALAYCRREGRPDEHCLMLLVPLLRAGFWGDLGAQARHMEAAFAALCNVTGLRLASRLRPLLGKRLALLIGRSCAALRYLLIPRARRFPRFADNLKALLGAATTASAAASGAFDPRTAARIVAHLDPLAGASKRSATYLSRELCLATAELGAGRLQTAARRFGWLLQRLERPVRGLGEYARLRMFDGCLHGRAQAQITSDPERALALAEQLERRDPFFAPHVEIIRMVHFAQRGEQTSADLHRARAEVLAVRGGIAWSACAMINVRGAYACMLTRDAAGLTRAHAELEQAAQVAPVLGLYRELCRANLELLRGRPALAAEIFEQVFGTAQAAELTTHGWNCVHYAEALRQLGRFEDAHRLCKRLIRKPPARPAHDFMLQSALQQLALIDAARGEYARAGQLLRELLSVPAVRHSPLWLGALHRDCAQAAILAGDKQGFDRHFDEALHAFQPTKNPALIQQCHKLLQSAVQAGLVASPVWQEHSLMAPANTQELLPGPMPPDMSENVGTGSS